MERGALLGRLPPLYAEALLLHEAGVDNTTIAARLGIERESVEQLVRLARAKIARLANEEADR